MGQPNQHLQRREKKFEGSVRHVHQKAKKKLNDATQQQHFQQRMT
jgi:hypothetical protein